MEADKANVTALSVLGSINLIFSGYIIYTYLKSKKMRSHPSGIIVAIAICELGLTYHSLIYLWTPSTVISDLTLDKMRIWRWFGIVNSHGDPVYLNGPTPMSILCFINQLILVFCTIAEIIYNFILCIDLMLSLRNPFSSGSKRMLIYNITAFVLSTSFTMTIMHGHSGQCDFYNNWGKNKLVVSNPIWLIATLIAYCFLGYVSIFYAIIRQNKGLKISNDAMKQYVRRHVCYVFFYIINWSLAIFNYILEKNEIELTVIDDFSMYLSAITGVVLAFIRISNMMVKKTILVNNTETDHNVGNEWTISITSILHEINSELSANIFDALYSVYSKSCDDQDSNFKILKQNCKEVKNHMGARSSRLATAVYGTETSNVYSELLEFAPSVFKHIRFISNVSESQMMHAMDPVKNIGSFINANESQGKSGSFFMISHDRKLVLKTIKKKECKILIEILQAYAAHLKNYPNSLLCRIYGLFYLKLPGISSVYLIVMDNILKDSNPALLFDLKGSTLGRKTEKSNDSLYEKGKKSSGPLKDLDFLEKQIKIKLADQDYEEKKKNLIADSHFLEKYKLMDYSLLVSAEKISEKNPVFVFGIIDFLTRYGFFKRMERAYTVLRNPRNSSEASVINPEKYKTRFLKFILGKVLAKKEE